MAMASQSGEKFKFPMAEFMAEEQHPAKLCHVETPDSFYITLSENYDQYNELFDELTRVYSHCLKEKSITPLLGPIGIGDHCVYRQDPFFLRGEVMAIKDNSRVDMLDVDTGEISRSVSMRSLFPVISNSFIRQTPMLAPHCKLPDIVPIRSSSWDEEVMKYFMDNYAERPLSAEFVGREGDLFLVKLYMKSGREVIDHMISIGLGRRPKRPAPLCHLPKLDLNARVGDNVDVIISYVESPSSFFVQLSRNEDLISKLGRELYRTYAMNFEIKAKTNPVVGEFCAAEYVVDGCWYRALVTSRLTPSTVEVQFVDHGNKSRVPTKDLRPLKPEFCRFPPQAIECCLSGVRSLPGMSERFDGVAEGQRMVMHIESVDYHRNVVTVTLLLTVGSKQYNINDYVAGRAARPPVEHPGFGVVPCPYPDNEYDLGSDDEDQRPGPSSRSVQPTGNLRYVERQRFGRGRGTPQRRI